MKKILPILLSLVLGLDLLAQAGSPVNLNLGDTTKSKGSESIQIVTEGDSLDHLEQVRKSYAELYKVYAAQLPISYFAFYETIQPKFPHLGALFGHTSLQPSLVLI